VQRANNPVQPAVLYTVCFGTPALDVNGILPVENRLVLMNQPRRALPGAAGKHHRIAQVETATAGGTGFQLIQHLKVDYRFRGSAITYCHITPLLIVRDCAGNGTIPNI